MGRQRRDVAKQYIGAAYQLVLRREPDAAGFAHYSRLYRTGRMKSFDHIVMALRASTEARQRWCRQHQKVYADMFGKYPPANEFARLLIMFKNGRLSDEQSIREYYSSREQARCDTADYKRLLEKRYSFVNDRYYRQTHRLPPNMHPKVHFHEVGRFHRLSANSWSNSLRIMYVSVFKREWNDEQYIDAHQLLHQLKSIQQVHRRWHTRASLHRSSVPLEPPPEPPLAEPPLASASLGGGATTPLGSFNDFMGVNAVYVLNLKRRADRRVQLATQLSRLGVNPWEVRVFDATDGQDADIAKQFEEYGEWVERNGGRVYNQLESAGALGCLLSYRRLVDTLLRDMEAGTTTDHSRVLILEDDACFHHRFRELWERANVPSNADVVRLGANQTRWEHCTTRDGVYKVPHIRYAWTVGAFALLLSRAALEAWRDELSAMPQREDAAGVRGTADMLLWMASVKRRLVDVALFPNAVVANVKDSDVRGPRDVDAFCASRRWNRGAYYVLGDATAPASKDQLSTNWQRWVDLVPPRHRTFVFVISSYNNEDWVARNLGSVCAQTYPHWRAIYVDDASADGTLAAAKNVVEANGCSEKFTFVCAPERRYQAHSRYVAYNHASLDDLIASVACASSSHAPPVAVLLDGDDWLIDDSVLSTLTWLYDSHDVVCTYGQFVEYENAKVERRRVCGSRSFPAEVIARNSYRAYRQWTAQHLRTVELQLLRQIPAEYLQHEGEWIRCCTDVAEMLFVLERSNGRHMNAGRPLLVYNKDNSKRHATSYYLQDRHPDERHYRRVLLDRYFMEQPCTDVDDDDDSNAAGAAADCALAHQASEPVDVPEKT